MELTFDEKEGIKVVDFIGRLDGNNAKEVQEKLLSNIEINDKSEIILNMPKCEYISSAGLRLLMILAKDLKMKGGIGVIAGMIEEVQDVMEMTGFSNIFKNFFDVETAVDYIQSLRGA